MRFGIGGRSASGSASRRSGCCSSSARRAMATTSLTSCRAWSCWASAPDGVQPDAPGRLGRRRPERGGPRLGRGQHRVHDGRRARPRDPREVAASRTDSLASSGESPIDALLGGYHLAFLVGAIFAIAAATIGAVFLREPRWRPRTAAGQGRAPELAGVSRATARLPRPPPARRARGCVRGRRRRPARRRSAFVLQRRARRRRRVHEPLGLDELGSAPAAVATTGTPAAIASAAARPKVSAEREGTSASAARCAKAGELARPTTCPTKRAPPRGAQRGGERAVAGDDERQPGSRAASTATSTPFSGARREATSTCSPAAARERRRTRARTCGHDGTRADAAPERAQALRREARGHEESRRPARPGAAARGRARRRRPPPRRAVPRQFRRTPGSVSRPWQRVQSSPRGKARPHRAHEPVVVQVQHDARAGRAGGGQRAPAEGRVDVVGADDAGARCGGPRRRRRRAAGRRAASPPPRARAPERGAVALEQLGLLAQVLAHEPRRSSTARSSPPVTR